MPASRLGNWSLGASGSAGVACLRLPWGLGACARVCGGGEPGAPRAWLCLCAAGCVSAGKSGAERTAEAAGSLGYLSRSVLGGCAQLSGGGGGKGEKRCRGEAVRRSSGGEQSMEQRSGRAGESLERPVRAVGQGLGGEGWGRPRQGRTPLPLLSVLAWWRLCSGWGLGSVASSHHGGLLGFPVHCPLNGLKTFRPEKSELQLLLASLQNLAFPFRCAFRTLSFHLPSVEIFCTTFSELGALGRP